MKKTAWYTKLVTIVLVVVLIFQPLSVLADENTSAGSSVVVNLIKAETIQGNYRRMEITFNTPVRFVDGNPMAHIFVSDSAEPNPGVNGSWQIGLDNSVENCKAINPVNISGNAYATTYDLVFAEDINKSGVLRITESAADTNNDLSSVVCNADGIGLTATLASDSAPDVASVDYVIKDQLISANLTAPNKAILKFSYDTNFIVDNPYDYVSAINSSNDINSHVSATSYTKIDNRSYEFTFDNNLPPSGIIKITENNGVNATMPIWITEIGQQNKYTKQQAAVASAYINDAYNYKSNGAYKVARLDWYNYSGGDWSIAVVPDAFNVIKNAYSTINAHPLLNTISSSSIISSSTTSKTNSTTTSKTNSTTTSKSSPGNATGSNVASNNNSKVSSSITSSRNISIVKTTTKGTKKSNYVIPLLIILGGLIILINVGAVIFLRLKKKL